MRVGTAEEDRAARYLAAAGYTLVTRRYVTRHGELDIVALDEETWVFVEVKSRARAGGLAATALSSQKRQRWADAVNDYRAEHGLDEAPFRLDMVYIDPRGIEHLRDVLRD